MNPPHPLLEIRDLHVRFPVPRTWPGRSERFLAAVQGVHLDVGEGETVGLVGESGCGKTTVGRAAVRLLRPTSGLVRFAGNDLTSMTARALRPWRRQFQMVFQDPLSTLDPRWTIGHCLAEALEIHHLTSSAKELADRVERLLEDVGLSASLARRYPHEFSGGQRQRVGIARALAVDPRLIVCDEAVSALDVSVQAQILNLLRELQVRRKLAYLFISHDLAVVEHLSHRVLVMYLGRIVEEGPVEAVCRTPRHPYTQALVSAVPRLEPVGPGQRLLPGEPPNPLRPPGGCPFHPRCPLAEARCRVERPELRHTAPNHRVACHVASGGDS